MAQNTTKYKLDTEGNNGTITVGEAVSINDLLYNDELTGRALKVVCTDNAAVGNLTYGTAQTSEATGRIVAETVASNAARFTSAVHRNQGVLNDAREFIHLQPNSSSNGIKVARFRSDGQLMNVVTVDTQANQSQSQVMVKLSNGNIAIAYEMVNSIKYAVYDGMLNEVKSLTTLVAVSSATFHMIALSGGGFAICYHDDADNTKNKLVILNNSGTITVAAVDIWTRTGTNGNQQHKMAQLSNGNIVIAVHSNNTGSSIGLYYAIFSASAVSVKAMAVLDATAAIYVGVPEVDVMTGFFCIARANTSAQKAFVFNNAGTLQGAEFSSATTSGNAQNKIKIVNDGTSFYLLWQSSVLTRTALTVLPTTGTNYLTSIPSDSTVQNPHNLAMDAFYENGAIVFSYSQAGSTSNRFFVIDSVTRTLVNSSSTEYGAGATTTNTGNALRLIPCGDRTFIAIVDYTTSTPSGYYWIAGKYARTAISGVAKNSASALGTCKLKVIAAFAAINPLKGSTAKLFDHQPNTLPGNKGAITLRAITLKGF